MTNMPYHRFIWTGPVVVHLAGNDISQDDFEWVVQHPTSKGISRTTGLPVVWGNTLDDRYIIAVYAVIDEVTVLPVTAYEVARPR